MMTRTMRYSVMLGMGTAVLLALALWLVLRGSGGAPPPSAKPLEPAMGGLAGVPAPELLAPGLPQITGKTEQAAPEPSGGLGEGVKVHGKWTIDVRGGGGSLVSRTEFENALVAEGSTWLTKVLGRNATIGTWAIVLFDASPSGGPCLYGGAAHYCGIVEPNDPISIESYYSKNLVLTNPTTGPDANKLVLSGSATAMADGSIARVSTYAGICSGANVTPSACSLSNLITVNFRQMTEKTLVAPITVLNTQQVQVTVRISLS